MKTPDLLTKPQQAAITAIYESNKLLIAQMGTGKTIIAATAISELLDNNELNRVLIVTTKQIAENVWQKEFSEWSHTKHIKCAAAVGTPAQREEIIRDLSNQVIVITFGTVAWFVENKLYTTFDGLLIDETTKVKKTSTIAFKALSLKRVHDRFKWRCGLSATPAAEHICDLYTQLRLIDGGITLGTSFRRFSFKYFHVIQINKRTELQLMSDTIERVITDARGSLYIMPDTRNKDLPAITYEKTCVDMPTNVLSKYEEFKKERKIDEYVAMSKGILCQKLQQLACGFIYDDDKNVLRYTEHRQAALLGLLEKVPPEENIIIAYVYEEDLDTLLNLLPGSVLLNSSNSKKIIPRWNAGEIKYLLLNSKSASHGIQLEKGGRRLIWYSPQYSYDMYNQTNSRIWRTGQKKQTIIHEVLTNNSIDLHIINRLRSKEDINQIFNSIALAIV